MPQLDGLRALAVIAVMVAHFTPTQWIWLVEPLGPLGVRLFFVLSGYLITGILLRERDAMQIRGVSLGSVLRRFYIRRTLRIFPMFYLTILVTFLMGIPAVRETVWWHVSYLSNFLFAVRNDWVGRVSHFWSLAVEEQFYMVWPWVVLLVPRKWLMRTMIAVIVMGPLSRLITFSLTGAHITTMVLTTSCLDTLGLGALLALLSSKHEGDPERRRRFCRVLRNVGLPPLVILSVAWVVQGSGFWPAVWIDLCAAAVFVWLVERSAARPGDWFGKAMEWPWLVACGRMSYSLYLTHNFMPIVLNRGFAALGWEWSDQISHPWQSLLLLAGSLAAASLARIYIELPFLRLKERLDQSPGDPAKRAAVPEPMPAFQAKQGDLPQP